MTSEAFLGLGASDPGSEDDGPGAAARLEEALRRLAAEAGPLARVAVPAWSTWTDPSGRPDPAGPRVLNTVASLRTDAEPEGLLALLHDVERALGRRRDGNPRRPIDLDLLDFGPPCDGRAPLLPHPRFCDRAFVLGPWEAIAPDHVVAGTGETVLRHAAALRASRPEAFDDLHGAPPLAWPAVGTACDVLPDREALRAWRDAREGRVGLVPTMGALHEGHAALLRRARAECDHVLATVFVNPLQFGVGEDLERYPRTFDADRQVLAAAGADAVYAPEPEDVYPDGHATYVLPEGPALGLEGDQRPGHFRGVATVVHRLWVRTRPHRAYFGCKDAQQMAVIRRMVLDLELPGEVVACPIVRDEHGMALSSRNRYLAPDDRVRARGLSRSLEMLARVAATGTEGAAALKRRGLESLRRAGLEAVYLEIVDPETFRPAEVGPRPVLAAAVVRVGATRLLDNRLLVVAPGRGTAA